MAVQLKSFNQNTTPEQAGHADDLAVAREVLTLEANALQQQAAQLDERFSRVLDIVAACTGRLIVTGMGKAGHVGKKITATLASTGTPAYFVHPAEASHGDLGMIGENDAVLALSKSGESAELRDIVNYCKRFSIPLIAMTQSPESTLAKQADVLLSLAQAAEACPNQQAPTTSTTLMMALGDALAVALMKRRGFTATDFRQYHPGGKLGGQLLTVAQVMRTDDALPLVADTATMQQAIDVMSALHMGRAFGRAIVVDARGDLAGFLSDGDIRRHLSADLLQQKITDIMNPHPRMIDINALAAAALATMNENQIIDLVVVNDRQPVGLIRLHDIMRAGVA